MPVPADTAPRLAPRRSAGVAAILGWIVPGLGQVYVNRPWKGLWLFLVICGTYALGLQLSGFSCVDPDRDPVWFAGQALAGGPTAAAWWFTRGLTVASRIPTYDVGLLYVTVAALLNVIAIADALGTVDEFAQTRAEQERRRAVEAAIEKERRLEAVRLEALRLEEAHRAEAVGSTIVGDLDLPPAQSMEPMDTDAPDADLVWFREPTPEPPLDPPPFEHPEASPPNGNGDAP